MRKLTVTRPEYSEPVIPAEQAVSKPHPREATAPEIVIPAKAGIQAGVERGNAA